VRIEEMVEYVAKKLLAQGGPSYDPNVNSCMYEIEMDGSERRCAVGWLMEDDQLEYLRRNETAMLGGANMLPKSWRGSLAPEDLPGDISELWFLERIQDWLHDTPAQRVTACSDVSWKTEVKHGARILLRWAEKPIPEWCE